MGWSLVSLTALLLASSWLNPAWAQSTQPTPAAGVAAAPPIGFEFNPGVTFVPSVFAELGYDTNPGQTFYNAQGSGFVRSGAGFAWSSVSQGMVANISATASELDYFNSNVFEDSNRFAGAASANVTYLVQPGLTASSGAFVNYDAQSVNKSQSAGGNIEAAYSNDTLVSVFRGKFYGIQYLDGGLIASPISLTSAFNYNRAEGTWTGLFNPNSPIAPYLEASGARVEYTDQPAPAVVNRSADDYHIKTGVRLSLTPEVTADVGWRFNWRLPDDHRIDYYNSNYFDGALTWRPSPFFTLSGSIERYIGEPSTDFAVLSDVRSYQLKANYLPIPGVRRFRRRWVAGCERHRKRCSLHVSHGRCEGHLGL